MKQNTTRFLSAHLRMALAGVLWLCLAMDVGHAATAAQPLPNGILRGFYLSVKRDFQMCDTRWGQCDKPDYKTCDMFVVMQGDGIVVDPLMDRVKAGNTINLVDVQGRLMLNLDLRGVPAVLRRRLTKSSASKPIELIAQIRQPDLNEDPRCASFIDLVAIDGKVLPGAPQGGSSVGALGSIPDVRPAPAATALSQPSMAGIATAQAATWFFSPHPPGQMEAVRSMNASMQTFQGGLIVYLDDVKQSFVLFNDGSWVNVGAGLDAAAAQYAGRLGSATNAQRDFRSCGGHVVNGDQVTAYVKDASGRVLAWTILASSFTPLDWRVVAGAKVVGC
jgi:hypothetical protein